MTQLVKEDPSPRPRRHPYNWNDVARQCKADPDEWYKVFENDRHSLVVAIQAGSVRALHPNKGFVTKTQRNHQENGRRHCAFYIKYEPSKDDARRPNRRLEAARESFKDVGYDDNTKENDATTPDNR